MRCESATCDVDDNSVAVWGPLALGGGPVHVQPISGSQAIGQAARDSGRHKVEDPHLREHGTIVSHGGDAATALDLVPIVVPGQLSTHSRGLSPPRGGPLVGRSPGGPPAKGCLAASPPAEGSSMHRSTEEDRTNCKDACAPPSAAAALLKTQCTALQMMDCMRQYLAVMAAAEASSD